MSSPKFSDIQKLMRQLVYPFYQIERDLPLPLQNHRNETDAEHSWSLAFLASCLAPEIDPQLDVGKCCRFAVIHDVVEVYAGDTSIWAKQSKLDSKHEREKAALEKITKNFSAFPALASSIREYEAKDSKEALFIFALDKFIAALNLYEDKGHYFIKNKLSKTVVDEKIVVHRKKAKHHDKVGIYYDKLLKALDKHPEYFYQGEKK